MIRDLNLHDLYILEKYAKVAFPRIAARDLFVKKAVEIDDLLLGVFTIQKSSEISLFLNDVSGTKKAKAILEINKYIEKAIHDEGIYNAYAFTDDEHYREILKKHFNFVEIKEKALWRNDNG